MYSVVIPCFYKSQNDHHKSLPSVIIPSYYNIIDCICYAVYYIFRTYVLKNMKRFRNLHVILMQESVFMLLKQTQHHASWYGCSRFSNRPSVDGCLDCFQVLTIINRIQTRARERHLVHET